MLPSQQLSFAASGLALLVSIQTWALPPLPKESGFRGAIRVTLSATDAETNLARVRRQPAPIDGTGPN
jgi:hypothetical protein